MEYLDFETYSHRARAEAHKIIKHVPKDMEIDHILSIKDAHAKGIPVDLVSHPANLQLLPIHENRTKGSRSDIGEFELISRIRMFERQEKEDKAKGAGSKHAKKNKAKI